MLFEVGVSVHVNQDAANSLHVSIHKYFIITAQAPCLFQTQRTDLRDKRSLIENKGLCVKAPSFKMWVCRLHVHLHVRFILMGNLDGNRPDPTQTLKP